MHLNFVAGCNYVWRLIKIRMRSERETRDKLKSKEFPPDVEEQIIQHFKEIGQINDSEFASSWLRSRLAKPLGFRAISIELKQKGIAKDIIEQSIAQAACQVDEEGIVRKLAQKRWELYQKRPIEPAKIKNKLYAYLMRRGFKQEIIVDVLNSIARISL